MFKVKQGLFVVFIVTALIFLGVNNSGAENPENDIKTIEITEAVINENINDFEEELFSIINEHSEIILSKEDIKSGEKEQLLTSNLNKINQVTNDNDYEDKDKVKEIVFTVGDVSVRYKDIETYYEDDFEPYKEEYPDINKEETQQSDIDEEILEKEMFVSFEEEVEEFNIIPDIYYGKEFQSYNNNENFAYDNTAELLDVPLGTENDIYETSLAVEFGYEAPELLEVTYREEENEVNDNYEEEVLTQKNNDKNDVKDKQSLPSRYDDAFYYTDEKKVNPYKEYAYYYKTLDFEDFQ